MAKAEPVELREFVREALSQLEVAVESRNFTGPIEFEVSLTHSKNMDGALKFYVASGQVASSVETMQKMRFGVYPRLPEHLEQATRQQSAEGRSSLPGRSHVAGR